MTQQLNTLMRKVETLSMGEQLTLIAHLVQNIKIATEQTDVPARSMAEKTAAPSSKKTIRQILDSFSDGLSAETLAQIPTDGAEQHDHYIYGTPKT